MSDERDLLGYVIGPDDDAVTVCRDCEDTDHEENRLGTIRDDDVYGDEVAYPECHVCEEVMRPETVAS